MKTTTEAILQKFKFRSTRDNLPMSPPRGDRNNLAELFGEIGLNKGVEVGTQRGLYAKVLCEKNPNIELVCVDPWCAFNKRVTLEVQDANFRLAQENTLGHNVKFMRMFSMDAVIQFADESLDFVYIDGDHTFDHAAMDIICWSKKVRSGGIVACHDYFHFFRSGVVQAVDAYTHCNMIDPWFCTREAMPTAFWVKL